MRLIWEENIEKMDYLELIVTPEEAIFLAEKGIVEEFDQSLTSKRQLNVFIRIENTKQKDKTYAMWQKNDGQESPEAR